MSTDKKSARIISMDQFRGYTVAGMFLVNFVGSFTVVKAFAHGFLVHNNTHFSYADSIMPSFMFCAGFSYRLTALRRFRELGTAMATWSYLRRSLALVFISLFAFGLGTTFKSWDKDMTPINIQDFFFGLIKADMWETLAIIGVCQILILPFIIRSFWTRFGVLVGFAAFHVWASYSFNYAFQLGLPNWFNQFWGAHTQTTWDGGMFGTFAWSVPMLAGTLVYDVLATHPPAVAFRKFMIAGIVLMASGYLLSCGTRLYDRTESQTAAVKAERDAVGKEIDALKKAGEKLVKDSEKNKDKDTPENKKKLADGLEQLKKQRDVLEEKGRWLVHARDAVLPKAERWKSPGIGLAEAPFVKPPDSDHRELNYWMMTKKFMALSFNLFALGFALALYSLFIVACDLNHWELGLFRTLGQNPLAAYLIHEATSHAIRAVVPSDSPAAYITVMFAFYFWVTWVAIRYMENHKLYLRL
ncbi:MAG: hypothetical protein U0903_21845 [Planctomycetales bacterium]